MCLRTLFVLLLMYSVTNYSYATEHSFRPDYHYIEATQAFYKFHTKGEKWADAKRMCESEGTSLYYPKNKAEAKAVASFWKDTQSSLGWIYIGISDLVVKGLFATIDGNPISTVYNYWHSGEPNDAGGVEDCLVTGRDEFKLNDDSCTKSLPYICKKSLNALNWNKECNIPYAGYQYNKEQGKCYKFHKTAMNWTDAYVECSGELSYLAVINSKREREHLLNVARESTDQVTQVLPKIASFHIGIHNRRGEGWRTLQGKSIEGNDWDIGQPDGFTQDEKCGSMAYTGRLHDVGCYTKSFFICEHDIDPQLS